MTGIFGGQNANIGGLREIMEQMDEEVGDHATCRTSSEDFG